MKKIVLYISFILFTVNGFSQSKEIDSLKALLKDEPHDTIKVSLFLELAKLYKSYDLEIFDMYAKKAVEVSKLNNDYKLVNAYINLGMNYYYNSKLDSARYCYDEALELLYKRDDKILRAKVYSNYALTYQETYDYQKKIDYNLKAVELIKDNDYEVSLQYYNLAVIYAHAQLDKKREDYLKKAYITSKRSKNNRVLGATIYGIAMTLVDENKIDSAKVYLKEGLELCKETNAPDICFLMNNQQGIIYKKERKFIEANEYLLLSKEYAKRLNRRYDIMVSNITLGQNEYERGNYSNSSKYFQEFDELYQEEPVPALGVSAYLDYAKTESKRNKFKKSYELLNKYLIIKDSTLLKERRAILTDAESKYQSEKKDKELAEQQLQLEQQQSDLQKRKIQYSYMTGLALFLLVASILSWFLYQQRQKRKNQEILTLKREQQVKTLESLMEGEEKERFRIARELHDGVNGDLSAIKYKLTSMLEKNTAVVNEVVEMIDRSCEQVRAISHNLVPPSLEKFSLTEALEDYCATVNEINEPNITFQAIGDNITISKKNEVNIYRVIQELVNNSIRHAQANEITVQISSRLNRIQITVEDNGKGFDIDKVEGEGIGLKNIQSRVKYLNADIDFVSNSNGTSCTIEIEIEKLNDN